MLRHGVDGGFGGGDLVYTPAIADDGGGDGFFVYAFGGEVFQKAGGEGAVGMGIVAGDPFDEQIVAPSSGAWARAPGETSWVAFFTTDGGTTALPPDGKLREAKLLWVEFSGAWKVGELVGALPGN